MPRRTAARERRDAMPRRALCPAIQRTDCPRETVAVQSAHSPCPPKPALLPPDGAYLPILRCAAPMLAHAAAFCAFAGAAYVLPPRRHGAARDFRATLNV